MAHPAIRSLHDMDAHSAQDHLPDHEAQLGGEGAQQGAVGLGGPDESAVGMLLRRLLLLLLLLLGVLGAIETDVFSRSREGGGFIVYDRR